MRLDQHAIVHVRGSIQEAVELVTTYANKEDAIEIFVTGSLHPVGGLISMLDERRRIAEPYCSIANPTLICMAQYQRHVRQSGVNILNLFLPQC